MLSVRKRSWLPANLLLVTLLIAAQSGALAHVFEHEAATPQNPTCAICVTVGQLHASAVDALVTMDVEAFQSCLADADVAIPQSLSSRTARQRGPPPSL